LSAISVLLTVVERRGGYVTQVFVPAARPLPPAIANADIIVESPPDLPSPAAPGLLPRLLPVGLSVASTVVMVVASASGTAVTRNPMLLALPTMMLVSAVAVGVTGRARWRGGGIDADRRQYLAYLGRLRDSVSEIAVAQCCSSKASHPDPDTLWTLIGGPRMWERRATDADFCLVRVGIGTQSLACRLVAPQIPSEELCDPVTASALRRFIHTQSTIVAPATIGLRDGELVRIDGDVTVVRGLLRAMLCQLAVLHPPDQVLIIAAISDRNRVHWDWLKWLPHNQHPTDVDETGPVRMMFPNTLEAQHALTGVRVPQVVVIAELDEIAEPVTGATTIAVGTSSDGAPLEIRQSGERQPGLCPDRMDPVDALICARRLAGYRVGVAHPRGNSPGWQGLVGLPDVDRFDPNALWCSQQHRDRLRVPIGSTVEGTPLELDIKEPAENGMGPHGLCVGATGSGKSELLRTIALGMMALNSPEVLNLLLIDFKGGATFLDLSQAPHVAAVITNLADDAPLVARMRDALAGEMNRRQQLLRTADCVGVAAYERARRAGAPLAALPTLFIIVDEFSELLSQHPDFADMFVAIGRLGRSLGVHLLLASQRLDEGRLRGLEAHLSYRMCLKTLSASESRTVLGTVDAYQLPATPGAGLLRTTASELIRFQAAMVSGSPQSRTPSCGPTVSARSVRVFSTRVAGPVTRAVETPGPPARTIVRAVLDRLSGQGPRAHRVWLPPLGPAPPLHTLLADAACTPADLRVPIGLVDRPFEQCRTPLIVDLSGAAGNVAVIGAPQSGKSTALRTLFTALAATHDPGQVQFYCLDFGGGALTSIQMLPHVGAIAGRAESRRVARIVAECESIVRRREAVFSEHGIVSMAQYRQRRAAPGSDALGDVFLVIDGWATVRQEFESLETSITAIAAQGLSFGVHVMLSASRWAEVRPSLRDQIGTRIELRLGEPADSELNRKAAQHVPRDSPGRGISRDGLHMVIALPVAEVPAGESVAPPIPLLPMQVDRDAVVRQSSVEFERRILLGLEERRLQSVAVDFGRHSHLLVLGDNECGKTATLRTLCLEIVRTQTAAQAQLLIVDFRRTLLGVVESEHLRGYAMSPAALAVLLPGLLDLLRGRMPPPDASQAELRGGSRWSGPDVYIVVDDYDLVATPAGNALVSILEFLPYARDLGLHLAIARRSGGAERALFEPLLASLRDLGCLTLMMSGSPGEGASFGSAHPVRLPPGRGLLRMQAGDEQLVQVAWSAP
jgi:DNA segregation ATPase FtsK/SpoIIIE, S-DNA-T family